MIERLVSKEILRLNKIGFDIDGVLVESKIAGVEKYNELRGTNHKVDEVEQYDQVKVWAMEEGMSEEEANKFNRQVWDDPEVLIKATPIDGAVELFEFMYQKNLKPPIITVRVDGLRDCTFSWFEKPMPFLDQSTIHVGSHQDITEGMDHKVKKIIETGVALFVEDSPSAVDRILAETNATVVLVVQKFNKQYALEQKDNKRILLCVNDSNIDEPSLRPLLKIYKDNQT
jgi:uncharacterized HAD superfamily protein